MAVGLTEPHQLLPIDGVEIATAEAGIRYANRDDMVLMRLAEGTSVAGVFTQNHFCAAPVTVARQNMVSSRTRALLINSGNANAGTGKQGMQNALKSCSLVTEELKIDASAVLPFSTGVIGEQLPMPEMAAGINDLASNCKQDNWLAAAKAIMTTDTLPKGISNQVEIDGETITITGIAKGSGMMCPDMATLLAYVATDMPIDNKVLQVLLERGTAASFNRITVDSDTSTNDALMLMATGKAACSTITSLKDPAVEIFYTALESVLISLATSLIRDAEGASKFVKVAVKNGSSEKDCEAVAYAVAHSPLVKTALFASDPNWGRLLMAVGKADVKSLDVAKIDMQINDVKLLENGEPANGYTEQAGQAVFQQQEIEISIDLKQGDADYYVWTSDLSHEYVSINADYRS